MVAWESICLHFRGCKVLFTEQRVYTVNPFVLEFALIHRVNVYADSNPCDFKKATASVVVAGEAGGEAVSNGVASSYNLNAGTAKV